MFQCFLLYDVNIYGCGTLSASKMSGFSTFTNLLYVTFKTSFTKE